MTKFFMKPVLVLGLSAALMASIASPSSARDRWVGPAVGFAAGVAVGAAAANANANPYYNDPYYAQGSYPNNSYYAPEYPAYPRYYGNGRSQRCTAENAGRSDQGC